MRLYLLFSLLFAQSLQANPENACLLMNTGDGVGTGFIVKKDDSFRLVSNQHVINGGAPHRYEKMDGSDVRPLQGVLAQDRDIVMFLLEGDFPDYLELEPDMNSVGLGEEVIIFGNSLGEGMRISEAKIVAKSPTSIEVTGGIVPGNSGGPIIRKETGKVIAVSTYVKIQSSSPANISEVIEASALPKVRYYGVRLDTARTYIAFDLRQFLRDRQQIKAAETSFSDALMLSLLLLEKHGGRLSPEMLAMARKATPQHRELIGLLKESGLYPGTYSSVTINNFRVRSESFLQTPQVPTSYIHRKEYNEIVGSQKVVRGLFSEILTALPVR